MSKQQKDHQKCDCGNVIKITKDRAWKKWEAHGYKFEGYVFYIRCNQCKKPVKIQIHKLSFLTRWSWREKDIPTEEPVE